MKNDAIVLNLKEYTYNPLQVNLNDNFFMFWIPTNGKVRLKSYWTLSNNSVGVLIS